MKEDNIDIKNIHKRFRYKSTEELQKSLSDLHITIPFDSDVSVLAEPVQYRSLSVANRFVVQPMEGFDASESGTPQEPTLRRYKRYALGGAGLLWFEATAVLSEARSNPHQLYLSRENVDDYKRLVAYIKTAAMRKWKRDVVIVIQLTHSGRFSKPKGSPIPLIAHHNPALDAQLSLPVDYPVVTDGYLDKLQETYTDAAKLAAEAGFDGVDIKSCHGYLLSELLASHTRKGKYGGSFENRTRMLRGTLQRIADEVPQVFITSRINAFDAIAHPYGFGVSRDDAFTPELTEPIELVSHLHTLGISMVNISVGNPYFNPHVGRPYDFPVKNAAVPEEHPLAGLARFIEITGTIQRKFPALPVVGSGYAWLRQFMPFAASALVKEGSATLIGQGRGSFAYPDAVEDILTKGTMDPQKCCITCSACTQIMRDGGETGCVVRDKEIYGPKYRLARRFSMDRLQQEAQRCRTCVEPTCSIACPAHVDIPGFIRSFADGNIGDAYDILRSNNPLPEMCAFLCPVSEQCQGGCVEEIFCSMPIPIADIQRATARTARLKGLTGVRLPNKTTGKSVGIIGGGPAGLACAIHLLEYGHKVVIYEKSESLGGISSRLIPRHRYEDGGAEIDAILKPARQSGRCEVIVNSAFGMETGFNDLRKKHDAILLAPGLQASRKVDDKNVDALDFLEKAKNNGLGKLPDALAVIGGGNTAADVATTAIKYGVKDVYLIYRRSFAQMPLWKNERDALLEAGVHLMILSQPVDYISREGKLTGLKVARSSLGEPDASGRRRPEIIPDSETTLNVDMVIEATGQKISNDIIDALPPDIFTSHKLIAVDTDSLKTEYSGVFAAGDCINGGGTVVLAVAEGLRAAENINAYLKNTTEE